MMDDLDRLDNRWLWEADWISEAAVLQHGAEAMGLLKVEISTAALGPYTKDSDNYK